MAGAEYDKSRPHMNIDTIGHVDRGKMALTVAITKVLTDKYPELNELAPFDGVDNAPEKCQRGTTIDVSHVGHQTDKHHYAHIDASGHTDYIKNMITGVAQMDGTILVAVTTGGPMMRAYEHVLLARQVGAPNFIVALSKADMVNDEEILEFVEIEIREFLSLQEYDGDNIPVVCVSTFKALDDNTEWVSSTEELMGEVDNCFPDPVRDLDKPFLMLIEDVLMITGHGTVAAGRVERGLLSANEEVEVLGIRLAQKTTVTGIKMSHKRMDHADAGENCGLLLHGTKHEKVERGQVVAKLGTITPHTNFETWVYVLKKEGGGCHNPFFLNYRPQFYLHTTGVTGVITLPEGTEMAMPGDSTEMTVELIQPIVMEEGLGFAIREGGRTVGSRRVTRIIK